MEKPFDLLVAIDMRGLAPVTMREKAGGRNFGARFGSAVPDSEASDHTQTPCPGCRLSLGRLRGPAKCEFSGDEGGTLGLEERDKIP
jgi:hypothetical protein